jgi:LacI family transcriptional regulator
MGVTAFNLLLEEMTCRKDGLEYSPRTIELETSIIERESTLKK